jgi:thiamine biosynthesis lipoprotein
MGHLAPLQGKAFRVGFVMGMPVGIDIRDECAHDEPALTTAVIDRCFDELRDADETFSLWRDDTPMARLSAGASTLADMPVEVIEVLRECVLAGRRTGGLFRARTPHGRVDPAGLVKAWAVERVGALLLQASLRHWCVNAAGDVLAHGQARPGEGWSVGIVDPRQRERLVDTLILTVGAVATSGSAERGDHIWAPSASASSREVLSVSVTARSIVEADVLATAAVARGRDAAAWLGEFPGVEGLVVLADGSLEATSGWPGSAAVTSLDGGR